MHGAPINSDSHDHRGPTPTAAEQTALQASIVDSAVDAISSATSDGLITTWNRAAEAMYGYAAEEVLGKSGSILCKDGPAEPPAMLEKLQRGEPIAHYEAQRRRKDGRTIVVSIAASPVMSSRPGSLGSRLDTVLMNTSRPSAEASTKLESTELVPEEIRLRQPSAALTYSSAPAASQACWLPALSHSYTSSASLVSPGVSAPKLSKKSFLPSSERAREAWPCSFHWGIFAAIHSGRSPRASFRPTGRAPVGSHETQESFSVTAS